MSKTTTIQCGPCNGRGHFSPTGHWTKKDECDFCGGYGYVHPPKEWNVRRRLNSGERFFFFSAWDDEPVKEWDQRDYVELHGGGCLYIAEAESYEPSHDRQKNFFFTRKEARVSLSKIRSIIRRAK